jgi:hypothetical protein
MKIYAAALSILSATILLSLAVHGQPQTAERPKFQIEIQPPSSVAGPSFTVTNLTGRTVTACALELSSSSSASKAQSVTVWDAVVLDQSPIVPGATISQYLVHAVGSPRPDHVEVIAGIWDDGETFGQAEWVSIILKGRTLLASQYEQAASLLQQGLDQNWTRDEFLKAVSDKPNSAPMYAIRSTLAASMKSSERPLLMWGAMKRMSERFTEKAEQLRQAKPISRVSSAS